MYEVGTADFRVYADNNDFLGIASAQLPDLNMKAITMNGAGIKGDVEVPILGQFDALTLSLTFRSNSLEAAKLLTYARHQIELRVAQQTENPRSGTIPVRTEKHVFVVIPKTFSGGQIAPATSSNPSMTFSVRYWATFIDGVKVTEIDQLNGIVIINGVDYNAPVRKALGL
jgi:P2 family phage contractile tail tube protein